MSMMGGLSWQGGWDEPGVLSVVLINGSTPGSGLFVYSGVPAAGNLIESIAATTGTDAFGNNYLAGDTVYLNPGVALNLSSGALTFYTGTNPHATFASQAALTAATFAGPQYGFTLSNILQLNGFSGGTSEITNDALSILNYTAAGADTNVYTVGHQILGSSTTTINNTVAIPVNGLSTNVAARSYYIKCILRCVAAASGTTQPMVPQLSGTATPSGTPWRIFTNQINESSPASSNTGNISGYNSDPTVNAGNVGNGFVFDWTLEGIVTFSVAGTLLVQARQVTSAADETFTVQGGSFLILEPI